MRFAGEGGQRLDDLVEFGLDVGRGGCLVVGVGVAGVGAGDGEVEVISTQVRVVWRSQWVLMCWLATQGRCSLRRSHR